MAAKGLMDRVNVARAAIPSKHDLAELRHAELWYAKKWSVGNPAFLGAGSVWPWLP